MRRRRKNNPVKLGMYGAVLAACVGGLGYITLQAMGQPVADELGCYAGVPAPQSAVMVDVSEPRFSGAQRRDLRTFFERAYGGLRFNERFKVFTTEGDRIGSILRPSFEVCGQTTDPQDLMAIGAQEAHPGFLARQKARLFERVLAPELGMLLAEKPPAARQQRYESPILEMIGNVSRAGNLASGDRLVVISDLLQNSEIARFCAVAGDMPRYQTWKQRAAYQQLSPPDLTGVEVDILMLLRADYGPHCAGEPEIQAFYRAYFKDAGASRVTLTRLRISAGGE